MFLCIMCDCIFVVSLEYLLLYIYIYIPGDPNQPILTKITQCRVELDQDQPCLIPRF